MILSWISKQENSPSSHLSLTLLLIVFKKQEFLLENSNFRIKTQENREQIMSPWTSEAVHLPPPLPWRGDGSKIVNRDYQYVSTYVQVYFKWDQGCSVKCPILLMDGNNQWRCQPVFMGRKRNTRLKSDNGSRKLEKV